MYVQCYAPDFGGEYVYAAFFPADANNQAQIGPLWSTVWPQSSAACQAQEGYFTRNGFGKWSRPGDHDVPRDRLTSSNQASDRQMAG